MTNDGQPETTDSTVGPKWAEREPIMEKPIPESWANGRPDLPPMQQWGIDNADLGEINLNRYLDFARQQDRQKAALVVALKKIERMCSKASAERKIAEIAGAALWEAGAE